MANSKKNVKTNKKPKRNITQIVAAVIAGLLALMTIATLIAGALSVNAVTQAEIDALKKKLTQTTAEKKALQGQLNDLSSDKSAVKKQIELLDKQITAAEDEIVLQDELLVQLAQMIEAKTLELAQSQTAQDESYEKARLRIRYMVEQGSTSYLTLLLSADDFASFLYRYEVIKQISESDTKIFENLRAIKEQVAAQKLALEESQALEKQTREEMEANKLALEKQISDKQKTMASIVNAEEKTKEAYKKMIEEEDALIDSIKKKAAELAAQKSFMGSSDGKWMWPLSSSHKVITCKYGMRTHPITGVYKLHSGVDVRADKGTKIYAANGGVVDTSAFSSAWGNYVVINHGGGYVTLYAHMSSRAVKEGAKVTKGDVIGYVGSTGYSTAPHLHFEIMKDGQTSNPLSYFKGIDFDFK